MVPLISLWLPIVGAAGLVFVASSILHMVVPFHKADWKKLPDEDRAMAALRPLAIPPGDYMFPCPSGPNELADPAFLEKMSEGPVAIMTVLPNEKPSMTSNLVQWFIYCVIVGFIAAYITSRALSAGASYLEVFRFAGCTAFVGYSLALWQNSIWYKRNPGATLRSTIDGLIYGLLTAGMFGWLWPR